MVQELLALFCLLDDKGVINIPKPKPWCFGGSADGCGFKLFCKQASYNGTYREIHGCTMDLFIILTLEEEVGIFQTEFQQFGVVLHGHGDSAV